MTDILTKLGVTESEFRALLDRMDRKPYRWVGERVVFDPQVEFTRPILQDTLLTIFDADYIATLWNNTAAWFTIVTMNIRAGLLLPQVGLYCLNELSFQNNTGATATLFWRFYDGTNYYPNSTGYSDGVGTSATNRPYALPFTVHNDSNLYNVNLRNEFVDQQQPFTVTGKNPMVDPLTLELQMAMSVASANFSFWKRAHLIYGPVR